MKIKIIKSKKPERIYLRITCPDCGNKLNIENKGRQEAVIFLYKKGYGIRQIQRIIGYKSPSSIQAIINKIK